MYNHCVYALTGSGTIVFIGETEDLEQRLIEHRRAGTNFTDHTILQDNLSPDRAKALELEALQTYRDNCGGRNPMYNIVLDG